MSLKWTIFTQIWPTFSPKPLIQSVSSTQEAIQPAFNQNAYSSQPDICEFLSILGLLDLIQKPKHNQKDHFEPIDGHLDYGGHLALLRIIPSFQLLGSVTRLCHVLAILGILDPIQKPKNHQKYHVEPIGGHFGLWQPSCLFENHAHNHSVLFIGQFDMFV